MADGPLSRRDFVRSAVGAAPTIEPSRRVRQAAYRDADEDGDGATFRLAG